MKTKDKKELHTKNKKELEQLLAELRQKLFDMQIQKAQKKLKNTSAVFVTRKDIARAQTILREKELQNENI